MNIDLTDGNDLEKKKHNIYALYKFRQMGVSSHLEPSCVR